MSQNDIRVICNGMLGTLAKWLRIYGVDAEYFGCDHSDNVLLQRAWDEKRILITRDRNLYDRCLRRGIDAIYLDSLDLNTQLKHVLGILNIDDSMIFTRCIICNVKIQPVDKSKIKERVPKRVFENYDWFYICPCCNRIYWPGTHYEDMMKRITKMYRDGDTR